jgi:protein-tyrosine phosphatase
MEDIMNILFVCSGNTCRSCMAEAIFNTLKDNKAISAFSAGAYAVHGSKTSTNSAEVVFRSLGTDISDRFAVQLNENHMKEADLVLTMTEGIRRLLASEYPKYGYKVCTINGYVGVKGDIIDPYGGSIEVYKNTYSQLKDSIELLLAKLKEDISI